MTFGKTFWAAFLAVIAGSVIMTILLFIVVASAAAFGEGETVVKENSVLKIDLKNGISDAPRANPLSFSPLGGLNIDRSNTILEAVMAVEKAAADDNIKGIYLDLSEGAQTGLAKMEELRKAILDFKESGKFVVAYADYYSQGGYYLASVADAVLLNPVGDLEWKGASLSVMFYKGLLDKLGVKAEILRHGTFKSAVEPFMLKSMSPENRLQYEKLTGSLWGAILDDVSASRGIDAATLSQYASDLTVRSARHAREYGLVDELAYTDQVSRLVKQLVKGEQLQVALAGLDIAGEENEKGKDKQEYVALSDYIGTGLDFGRRSTKTPKVALIYANGSIVGSGDPDDEIVGADIARKIAKARQDEKTKAVVLRVNSPGGSALASEVIWREMELTRQVKPVIVSMGATAASGGYYIACPADVILADRFTLTGSIGVFGLMFDLSASLENKLGITVETVKTNPSADLGSPYRSLDARERETIMYSIEDVYTTFVNHVSAGRNLTYDQVDAIGQGRVWSGVDALEIGLTDGFGGIRDAIVLAADRAGIAEDFRIWQVKDEEDTFTALLRQMVEVKAPVTVKDDLAELYEQIRAIRSLVREPGVKAMMPYAVTID